MRPLVLPASTVNTAGASVVAQSLAEIIIWGLQSNGVDVPEGIQLAILIVVTALGAALACHFTTDTPPQQVANEAVKEAAKEEAVDNAKAKRGSK